MYPHREPFLGLDLFLRTGKVFKEHRYLPDLWQRYQEYGHTFESNHFGSVAIHSIEQENLKTIWGSNMQDWGVQDLRLPNMEKFCGRGFITMDGPEWRRAVALLKPSFYKARISDLSTMKAGLLSLIDHIPVDGSTVDLQPLFLKLYLDTATVLLFGESIGLLSGKTPEHAKGFLDAFNAGFSGSGMRIALGPLKVFLSDTKWLQACRTTHNFADFYVDKAIKYREAYLAQKGNLNTHDKSESEFQRILLYDMAEHTGDRIDLRNQILQALMAAQETTACLLSNVFFLLARHPEVWNKLRNEILDVESESLKYDQSTHLTYLRNVLNETQRLYPVFPQMNRIALRDTILPTGGGSDGRSPVFAPAGTLFDTSFYVLHRLPEIWGADADEFNPDRWDSFKPNPWEYMPFGGGARACIGQYKAMLEASYVLVEMMHRFKEISSRDEKEWQGLVQLTAKNVNGCKVSLTPA